MVQPAGTVICFLCRGHVPYTRDNTAKFERHMATDHSAYFGMEYLLAGCKMTEDERLAVTDVVKEKEVGAGAGQEEEQEATLEEGEVGAEQDHDPLSPAAPARVVRVNVKQERITAQRPYKCSYCPKSFTLSDNLDEHINRKHPSKAVKNKQSATRLLSRRGIQKPGQKVTTVAVRRRSAPRGSPDVPEGEGFKCDECGNVYKTQSMKNFHYTDVHVQGHFPCKGGCGKIFTSKNKMSSHWSRHCGPSSRKRNSL